MTRLVAPLLILLTLAVTEAAARDCGDGPSRPPKTEETWYEGARALPA